MQQPRLLMASVLALSLGLSAAPAAAEEPTAPYRNRDGWGWTDGQGVAAEAHSDETTPARAPRRIANRVVPPPRACLTQPIGPDMSSIADEMARTGTGPSRGSGPGQWLGEVCVQTPGYVSARVRWTSRPANQTDIARRALSYAPLALPVIRMSPDPGLDQLVNVQTWLWVDPAAWAPMTTSASIAGVTVTTTAIPQRVRWDMGEGEQVVCAGPGTPYEPALSDATPACSYAFRRPAEHNVVTATIEWAVRWAAPGSRAGGGDLGTVSRSSSVVVRVVESQALNIAPSERSSR